jgi:hypothetical protein
VSWRLTASNAKKSGKIKILHQSLARMGHPSNRDAPFIHGHSPNRSTTAKPIFRCTKFCADTGPAPLSFRNGDQFAPVDECYLTPSHRTRRRDVKAGKNHHTGDRSSDEAPN